MDQTRQQRQAIRLQLAARALWQMRSDLNREVEEYLLNKYADTPTGFDGAVNEVTAIEIAAFIDLISQLDAVFATDGNPEKVTNML